MTLQELSESYAYSAELLSRRLAQLRQEEREARDESQRFSLHRRILDLEPLLRQCRQLHRLTLLRGIGDALLLLHLPDQLLHAPAL